MKVSYRGHVIIAEREPSMTGYEMLFYSIFRESDWYECVSNCEDSAETEEAMVAYLKKRVDSELASADPWCESDDLPLMSEPQILVSVDRGTYNALKLLADLWSCSEAKAIHYLVNREWENSAKMAREIRAEEEAKITAAPTEDFER